MKAKYKHYGNDCIIYIKILCVDNVVVKTFTKYIKGYSSIWYANQPEKTTTVCLTNAEARRHFWVLCKLYESKKYDCEYKEVKQ